jgi:hypothetical protein
MKDTNNKYAQQKPQSTPTIVNIKQDNYGHDEVEGNSKIFPMIPGREELAKDLSLFQVAKKDKVCEVSTGVHQ